MLTVAELTAAMKESGRHLTPRTARNWWSVGVLPTPDSRGLGRGKGKVVFWPDRRVLFQAQIAYDLLRQGGRLRTIPVSLWMLGFPVPFQVVRTAIEDQIALFYRRWGADAQGSGLEQSLWALTEKFVKNDTRARGGSRDDEESHALYDLTGQLLELLHGVGDGALSSENAGKWGADTAEELVHNIDLLALQAPAHLMSTASSWVDGVPTWMDMAPEVKAKTAKDFVTFVSETISVQIQSTAVAKAQSYDWTRARRFTHMVVGLLDRGFAVASPKEYRANQPLFARQASAWARLLFPVVLAVVQNPEQHQAAKKIIFAAAERIRRDVRTGLVTE